MMNREQALQWLVDNLKEWPESMNHTYSKDFELPAGQIGWCETWECISSDSSDNMERQATVFIGKRIPHYKLDNEQRITKQNWQSAQPAPASNKPSWDDAPEDAKILVQSDCGAWNFGSYKSAFIDGGKWRGNGKGRWFNSIHGDAPNPNWRDTLEYRPVVKESLITESEQDAERQYVPTNLARIKQLNDEIELAQLSIESMKIELAERTKEVQDVLNYCKFNA